MALTPVLIELSPDLEPLRNDIAAIVAAAGFAPVDAGTRLDLTRAGAPPTVWLEVALPADAGLVVRIEPDGPLDLAVAAVRALVLRAGAATPRRAGTPSVSVALRQGHAVRHSHPRRADPGPLGLARSSHAAR